MARVARLVVFQPLIECGFAPQVIRAYIVLRRLMTRSTGVLEAGIFVKERAETWENPSGHYGQ